MRLIDLEQGQLGRVIGRSFPTDAKGAIVMRLEGRDGEARPFWLTSVDAQLVVARTSVNVSEGPEGDGMHVVGVIVHPGPRPITCTAGFLIVKSHAWEVERVNMEVEVLANEQN